MTGWLIDAASFNKTPKSTSRDPRSSKSGRNGVGGAAKLHAGRGAAGGPIILDEQASYIRANMRLVEQAIRSNGVGADDAKARLRAKINSLYPDWPLAMLMDANIDGLAGELAIHIQA